MNITRDAKAVDLFAQYPWLKDHLVKMDDKLKKLNSPLVKIMLRKATIKDISVKTGINEDIIISKLTEIIRAHKKIEKSTY